MAADPFCCAEQRDGFVVGLGLDSLEHLSGADCPRNELSGKEGEAVAVGGSGC